MSVNENPVLDHDTTFSDLRSRIVAALLAGVWSPLIIAEELHCPIEAVHEVIANPGYGIQPYGSSVYGGFGNILQEQMGQVNAGGQPYLTTLSGAGIPSSGIRFKGEWYDAGINQSYMRNRQYEPAFGRFAQVDPARAGTNWYAFCGGDPVNRMDPKGLDWQWQDSGVLAAGGEWSYVEGTDPFVPIPKFKPNDFNGVTYIGPEQYRNIRDAYVRGQTTSQAQDLANSDGLSSLVFGGAGAFPTNFSNQLGPFGVSPYMEKLATIAPNLAQAMTPSVIASGSSDPSLLGIGKQMFQAAAQQGESLNASYKKLQDFDAHTDWLAAQARQSAEDTQFALSMLLMAAGSVGGMEAGVAQKSIGLIGEGTLASAEAASQASSIGWRELLGGVRIRQVGSTWVKEVNPNASALAQWWGRGALNAQIRGLQRLGDLGAKFAVRNGRLFTQDVGKFQGSLSDFTRIWLRGSLRLRTIFNDIRPRNIGANGQIFDPAKNPIQQWLEAAATAGAVGIGSAGAYIYLHDGD